jgi:hypothetical protein
VHPWLARLSSFQRLPLSVSQMAWSQMADPAFLAFLPYFLYLLISCLSQITKIN